MSNTQCPGPHELQDPAPGGPVNPLPGEYSTVEYNTVLYYTVHNSIHFQLLLSEDGSGRGAGLAAAVAAAAT